MDGTLYSQPKPVSSHELFERLFHRAMVVPEQIEEAFPEGCPEGTVKKILDTAIKVNPTDYSGYSAWLLYRWCEGRLTLTEMKQSGPVLEQYAKRVGELPAEARNVFGMHSLDQIEAVLSNADKAAAPYKPLFYTRTPSATLSIA